MEAQEIKINNSRIINYQRLICLSNYKFNTKMYKKTNIPVLNFSQQQSWMDQRVLTIMKKYEKPHQPASAPSNTPYQKQHSHTPNHWKHHYSPAHENHDNLESDGYRGGRRRPPQQQTNYSNYKPRTSYKQKQQSALRQPDKRIHTQNQYQLEKQNRNSHYKRPFEREFLNEISINELPRPNKELSNNMNGFNQQNYQIYPLQDKYKGKYNQNEPKAEERYSKSPYNCKNQTPYYKKSDESWVDKSCILSANKSFVPKKQSVKTYTQAQQLPHYKNSGNVNYIGYQTESKHDVQYDKRINNIERINNKIKQILSNQDHLEVAETLTTKSALKSLTPNKNAFTKEDACSRPKREEKVLSKGQNQRSKSCIGEKKQIERIKKIERIGKPKVSDEANDEKFKKIQDQITSFNKRVALLAEEKKKLNIQLPSSKSVQLKEPNQLVIQGKLTNAVTKKETKIQIQSKRSDKNSQKDFAKKSLDNLVTVESVHSLSEEQRKSNKQLEQIHEALNKRRQVSEHQNYSQVNSTSEQFSESQFYQSADQREQSMHGKSQRANSETKLLLKHLSQQVKLDEHFRITKNWFVYSDIHNEYEVLQSILGQRWREMQLDEIQAEFSVNFEEDDPFYSYRPDQFVLQDMVNNYIVCSRHWKEKVQGCWDTTKYTREGLIDKLDLENRGYIAIEDLVRILNMQEGTFFRNRDLYMIHQRFLKLQESPGERLSIEVFNSILQKN